MEEKLCAMTFNMYWHVFLIVFPNFLFKWKKSFAHCGIPSFAYYGMRSVGCGIRCLNSTLRNGCLCCRLSTKNQSVYFQPYDLTSTLISTVRVGSDPCTAFYFIFIFSLLAFLFIFPNFYFYFTKSFFKFVEYPPSLFIYNTAKNSLFPLLLFNIDCIVFEIWPKYRRTIVLCTSKGFTLCIHVYNTTLSTFDLFNSNFYIFFSQILWVVIKK